MLSGLDERNQPQRFMWSLYTTDLLHHLTTVVMTATYYRNGLGNSIASISSTYVNLQYIQIILLN